MPDITMCIPVPELPKCKKCYRKNAKPSDRQSYADFSEGCKENKYEYFWKDERKANKK